MIDKTTENWLDAQDKEIQAKITDIITTLRNVATSLESQPKVTGAHTLSNLLYHLRQLDNIIGMDLDYIASAISGQDAVLRDAVKKGP